MILFHRTTPSAAEQILRHGFCDGAGYYGTQENYRGVWLSYPPLDPNDFGGGSEQATALIEVTLTLDEQDIAMYEWVEEGMHYREWLIPAEVINRHCWLQVLEWEDEIGVLWRRVRHGDVNAKKVLDQHRTRLLAEKGEG
jgi:hypothetical protein